MALTEIKTSGIADDAVTTDKLANAINTARDANTAKATNATHTGDVTGSGSLTIADNAVTTAKIADANVTTDKLASDAVTGAKIADDAIDSEHYTDGSIDTDHIANTAVTTAKIANNAVGQNQIGDDEVIGSKIADNAVNEARLQVSNSPTNGYYLQAQSGNTGGLTWAAASASPDWQSFQAEMVGDQSITNSTWTKVKFNAQNWDTNSNYDHTDNDWCYEAPATGKYWYKASLMCKDLGENGSVRVALYKDSGSGYVEQKKTFRINYQPNASNNDITIETTGLISLAANDKIAVYGWHNHNAARDFDDNYCLFSMFKLDGA